MQERAAALQARMEELEVDGFLLSDADSVYYFAHYWGYLGMEFGRATLLWVPRDGAPRLITPAMEAEMARTMTWIPDVVAWEDGSPGEWTAPLAGALAGAARIAVERAKTPVLVLDALAGVTDAEVVDGTPLTAALRMIKTPEEIATMRQAGQVAVAMGEAARNAISEGVPEYEIALAVIAGGTRKAAELLDAGGEAATHPLISPTIYNLQILQSGRHTCMVHGRSTTKRLERGDPVYLCFCGIANFKQLKLGFDREFFVGSVTDSQARTYETTVAAQQAALAEIRPGAIAEEVNGAAEEVYRSAGLAPGYRTGRAIGYSFLEEPQLKRGDRTPLAPGMAFAVDGGITVGSAGQEGAFGARVGDSIVVTDKGFEYLTPFPRDLAVL